MQRRYSNTIVLSRRDDDGVVCLMARRWRKGTTAAVDTNRKRLKTSVRGTGTIEPLKLQSRVKVTVMSRQHHHCEVFDGAFLRRLILVASADGDCFLSCTDRRTFLEFLSDPQACLPNVLHPT